MNLKELASRGGASQAHIADVQAMLAKDTRPDFVKDAQAAMNFNRSTGAYVESRVFEKKYSAIKYPRLVPLNFSADRFAESIVYYSTEGKGQAGFIGSTAQDVPNVDVDATQHKQAVQMGAIGYRYSLEEQGMSPNAAVNFLVQKASTARLAYEKKMDKVAFQGDAGVGFSGLINNAAITPANVAQNAGASSRLWSAKTVDEVLTDLNDGLTASYTTTLEMQTSNTILMPPSALSEISSLRLGSASDRSVLEYFRQNNIYTQQTGQPITIETLTSLETAGAGGTRRMVSYLRDPEVLELHIPMPLEFMPPHNVSSLIIEVAGVFRTAGLEIRYPGAIQYRDGF